MGQTVRAANIALGLRIAGLATVALALIFIFNNWLIHWQNLPGFPSFLRILGFLSLKALKTPLGGGDLSLALGQLALYIVPVILIAALVLRSNKGSLNEDADRLTALSAYLVRGAFWAVFFVGLADATISFLRVEGILADVVGDGLAKDLGRSSFRGLAVHYPLILLSFIIAFFNAHPGVPVAGAVYRYCRVANRYRPLRVLLRAGLHG